MSQKGNFVFLASWYDIINAYDNSGQSELAGEISKQIIYYGVTGQLTTDDPIVKGMVTSMCATIIDKSKKRYEACKNNGKKGGKPIRYDPQDIIDMHKQGLSDQDIADNLGCSLRTVQRALEKDEI